MKWKAEPPTAPMPKAPPMSSRMRSGQGSREVSGVPMGGGDDDAAAAPGSRERKGI